MRTLKEILELAHLRSALRPLPGGVRKGPGAQLLLIGGKWLP